MRTKVRILLRLTDRAEALSGLARAFFYAGARALLVSHTAVYSDATAKLITGAAGRMAVDKRVGRAESPRQSILALIDKGAAHEAHPRRRLWWSARINGHSTQS